MTPIQLGGHSQDGRWPFACVFPMFVFPCSHRSNNTLGMHLVPGTVPCHHAPVHQQQCDIHMTAGLACQGTDKLLQDRGAEEGARWLCLS